MSQNSHRSNISSLKPQNSWIMLIDETGHFEGDIKKYNDKSKVNGSVCALMIPENAKLPPLKHPIHLKDNINYEYIDPVKESLNSIDYGILGLRANAFGAPASCWANNISDLIYIALVLLPIQGQTNINIYIEARGCKEKEEITPYTEPLHFQRMKDLIIAQLSYAHPTKCQQLQITIGVHTKPKKIIGSDYYGTIGEYTGKNKFMINDYNGYIDFATDVMFWSNDKLKRYSDFFKWNPDCVFIAGNGEPLKVLKSSLREGVKISPADFDVLLKLNANGNAACFIKGIIREHGEAAKKDPKIWCSYLQYVEEHLHSKAVNMILLHQQLKWLDLYSSTVSLPPKLRLMWLTVKLAESNHEGKALPEFHIEFEDLLKKLYKEDAPLVCKATLHFAVSCTNAFEFEKAEKILSPWLNTPEEVPGSQYYGELLSSYGQVLNFIGKQEAAIDYFVKAIDAFNRLSDENEKRKEISQTQCYLVIAMMDIGYFSKDEIEIELTKYFGDSLVNFTEKMIKNNENEYKYHHHVLLRYIYQFKKKDLIEQYCLRKGSWKTEEGHPWGLIQYYRALFLIDEDLKKAIMLMEEAININTDGIILKFIQTVMLAGLYTFDKSVRDELCNQINYYQENLPALGKERIMLLKSHLEKPHPIDVIFKDLLPFNFR